MAQETLRALGLPALRQSGSGIADEAIMPMFRFSMREPSQCRTVLYRALSTIACSQHKHYMRH
jgi:hypothetical protein